MALRNGSGPSMDYPEAEYLGEKPSRPDLGNATLLGAGAALAAALLWRLARRLAR